MLDELDAVAVIDERVSGDSGLLLIGFAETAVNDKTLAVGAHRCLAFDGANRHVTVDDTSCRRVKTELFENLRAHLLVVCQGKISPFLLLVRGLVAEEIALKSSHLILVVQR